MPWLPTEFIAPGKADLLDGEIHLRQISPDDTELDMIAVMGSQARLWSIFGPVWGWPTTTMTAEEDRADLQRHAEEMARNESFNYALFDTEETALLGCVYLDPPERVGADADISWWVIDELVGSREQRALDEHVPRWLVDAWPFELPRCIGHDLSWEDWSALPKP